MAIKQVFSYDSAKGVFGIGLPNKKARIFTLGEVSFTYQGTIVVGRTRKGDELVLQQEVTEVKNPDTNAAFTNIDQFDSFQLSKCYGPMPVQLQSSNVTITGPITVSNEVEVSNDSGNPIPVSYDTTPLEDIISNTSLLAHLGNINDAVAATDTGSFTLIAFIKRLLGYAKVAKGSGNIDGDTQRVTLAADGPGVANLSTIATNTGKLNTGVKAFGSLTGVVLDSFARPADTNAYTAGDEVNNSTSTPANRKFAAICSASGGTGYLHIFLHSSNLAATHGFMIALFNDAPTYGNDNAAFALGSDSGKFLGVVELQPLQGGFTFGTSKQPITLPNTKTDLYYKLIAPNGYTPASGTTYYIGAYLDANQ